VENIVLIEAQNGCNKNKSTDTASQTIIESIQEAIGLFFDQSKARYMRIIR
jgi:hypothetical protein